MMNSSLSALILVLDFPLNHLKNATQLFYQEDKSRQSRNHSGLGLTIANDIIRLHHGSLSLSNDNGTGGARVTIILPPFKYR